MAKWMQINKQITVSRDAMSPELEDEFRQRLPSFATPVFVHCGTGERAGTLVVMDKAVKEGWSGEDTLQRAGGDVVFAALPSRGRQTGCRSWSLGLSYSPIMRR